MALSKEVSYATQTENYLCAVQWPVQWPGARESVIDAVARMGADDERFAASWGLSDEYGEGQIKCVFTRQDNGGQHIWWFDPSKGYMWTRSEYREGDALLAVGTYRVEQVPGGAWFPTKYVYKGTVDPEATGGIAEYSYEIALDMDESNFNDRSAIPGDIFTLEMTSDVKRIIDYRFDGEPLTYDRDVALPPEELLQISRDSLDDGFVEEGAKATVPGDAGNGGSVASSGSLPRGASTYLLPVALGGVGCVAVISILALAWRRRNGRVAK